MFACLNYVHVHTFSASAGGGMTGTSEGAVSEEKAVLNRSRMEIMSAGFC